MAGERAVVFEKLGDEMRQVETKGGPVLSGEEREREREHRKRKRDKVQ